MTDIWSVWDRKSLDQLAVSSLRDPGPDPIIFQCVPKPSNRTIVGITPRIVKLPRFVGGLAFALYPPQNKNYI